MCIRDRYDADSTRTLSPADRLLAAAFGLDRTLADDAVAAAVVPPVTTPLAFVAPGLATDSPRDAATGIALAEAMGRRAVVPESGFHVGCVLEAGGVLVPGCNVETSDWGQILCAERNAVGTARSYGLAPIRTVWLHCPGDGCSPCGACRQVLAEHADGATVWMPSAAGPVATTPAALLPGAFTGASLRR